MSACKLLLLGLFFSQEANITSFFKHVHISAVHILKSPCPYICKKQCENHCTNFQ